jgi:hypothetical protein
MNTSSKAAGMNGAHAETLILGHPSNPSNLVDDPGNKIKIKSCRKRHTCYRKGKQSTRYGQFKINIDQHRHLVGINGFYLFVVLDKDMGVILYQRKMRARTLEKEIPFLERTLTKHHYFSLNWTRIIRTSKKERKKK